MPGVLSAGMDIPADELADTAKKLRRIARLLQAAGGDEEMASAAWLLTYADRCLDIAVGLTGPSVPYDIPNNVGD